MPYIIAKKNTNSFDLYNLRYNNGHSILEEYIEPFEQPVLTADGVLGGDSFAVWADSVYKVNSFSAFKAFDADAESFWHSYRGVKDTAFPSDFIIYNPKPINITKLEIYCPRDDIYWLKDYKIYASNDNSYYREIASGTTGNSWNEKFIINLPDVGYFKYWKIRALSVGGGRTQEEVIYGDIKISATAYTGTFYNGDSFMFERKGAAILTPFVQPTTTQIQNNIIGGDAFATDQEAYYEYTTEPAQKFYYLFQDEHEWQINSVDTNKWYWGMWYNPNPMKLTKLQFQNNPGNGSVAQVVLFASNDNVSWHEIGLADSIPATDNAIWDVELYPNQRFYKYFKIYVKPRITLAFLIKRIYITADEMKG